MSADALVPSHVKVPDPGAQLWLPFEGLPPAAPEAPAQSAASALPAQSAASALPAPSAAPRPPAGPASPAVRSSVTDEARASEVLLRVAQARRNGTPVRTVRVVFRPFRATLYSFRVQRDGTARVRFHCAFRGASEEVLGQAAQLMLCRTRRGRARIERRAYDAFVKALRPEAFELPGARRAAPRALPTPGRHRSLDESFARVNARYFQGALAKPQLCWSPKRSRRILGSFQERTDRLIVSRIADSARVPAFVLDYLMYHELLHKFLGLRRRRDGRRCLHGPAFRRLERRFERLAAARAFLRSL